MHGSSRGEVSRKRILWHYPSFLQPYKLLRFSQSPTKWGEMDWREWRDHFSGHWAGVHSIFSMSKRKILYFPSCQFAGFTTKSMLQVKISWDFLAIKLGAKKPTVQRILVRIMENRFTEMWPNSEGSGAGRWSQLRHGNRGAWGNPNSWYNDLLFLLMKARMHEPSELLSRWRNLSAALFHCLPFRNFLKCFLYIAMA